MSLSDLIFLSWHNITLRASFSAFVVLEYGRHSSVSIVEGIRRCDYPWTRLVFMYIILYGSWKGLGEHPDLSSWFSLPGKCFV